MNTYRIYYTLTSYDFRTDACCSVERSRKVKARNEDEAKAKFIARSDFAEHARNIYALPA